MTELMKYSMWDLGVNLDTEVNTHDNEFTCLNLVYAGHDDYGNPEIGIIDDKGIDWGKLRFPLTGFDNFSILCKAFGDDFACRKASEYSRYII